MDRTGIAKGTLRPCVYFSRRRDMYCILAPMEVNSGLELARMVYERRYKQDWLWCEATTLQEVDRLQKRLANQSIQEAEQKIRVNSLMRDRVYKQTGDALRSQMVSSSTTQWERDWIRAYLQLREDKRDKFRDSLLHRNYYIMAREFDEGKHVDEMLPLLPGQFERTESGGTPTETLKQIEAHDKAVMSRG
jgi:hypothetical protein